MSGTLGDIIMRGSETQAQLPKMWSDIAVNYGQLPVQRATAAELQARVPLLGAQTSKELIEADMQRMILQNRIKTLQDQGTQTNYNEPLPLPPGTGNASTPTGDTSSYYTSEPTPLPVPPTPPAAADIPPPRSTAPDSSSAQLQRYPVQRTMYAGPGVPQDTDQSVGDVMTRLRAEQSPGAPAPAPAAPAPGSATLMAQNTPAPGAPQQQGYNPNAIASGAVNTPIGPVPANLAAPVRNAIAEGRDPTPLYAEMLKQKSQRLATLARGATDPASWRAALIQAWHEGWIPIDEVRTRQDHFDQKEEYVFRLTDPATQANIQANLATHGMGVGSAGITGQPGPLAGVEAGERARATGGGQVQSYIVADPTQPGGYRTDYVPLGSTQRYLDEQRRLNANPQPVGAPTGGVPHSANVPNNNPGNLTFANQPGATRVPGSQFASFPDVPTGVAATADQLAINQDQHGKNTVKDQVYRWVGDKDVREKPAEVARYVAATAAALGVDPNAKVDWHDPNVQAKFILAQQQHETRGTIAPEDVQKGVQMAAARRGVKYAGPGVPQTPSEPDSPAAAIAQGMVRSGADATTLAPGPGPAGAEANAALSGAPTEQPPVQVSQSGQNPYALPGMVELTPQQKADLDVETERRKQAVVAEAEEQRRQYGTLGDQFTRINTAGEIADATRARLYDLQHAAEMFTTGTTAQAREAGWKAASTALRLLGIEPPEFMSSAVTGAEVINKEGNQLAQALTNKLGSNEAATVFQSILAANPNMNLSKGGFKAVVDSYVQGVQRDRDQYNFMNAWLADPKHNNSIRGMLPAFQKEHPVETYASRVLPFPMPMTSNNRPDASKMMPDVIYKNSDGSKTGRWNGKEMELQ